MRKMRCTLGIIVVLLLTACSRTGGADPDDANEAQTLLDSLDIAGIQRVLGMAGSVQDGQFKVTVPQNDLDVTLDGFELIPPMGMGSRAAFATAGDEAAVMGDIILQEDEIGPVEQVFINHGLTVTGLHNHFVREEPSVMYMHIGGRGSQEDLARGLRAALDRTGSSAE